MHVLITGSTGFLGKQTVLELKKDYELTFIGKKKKKNKNYIFCNLNNSKKISSILKSIKVIEEGCCSKPILIAFLARDTLPISK